jgi:hypothetical protein
MDSITEAIIPLHTTGILQEFTTQTYTEDMEHIDSDVLSTQQEGSPSDAQFADSKKKNLATKNSARHQE